MPGTPIGFQNNFNDDVDVADVKVSLKLLDIKEIHAKWIFETYEYLKDNREFITNGFEAAGITEIFKKAQHFVSRIDNPFYIC